MSEIHMFLGIGGAGDENRSGYRKGERHALLVFLAQPQGSEHDWVGAEAVATDAGWHEVQLTKAGTVSPENVLGRPEEITDAFGDALEKGRSLIVYEGAVEMPA